MVIKQKHLIEFQIYYLLIVEFLIDVLHFPEIIRYVLDANAIFIALLAIPKISIMLSDKVFRKFNSYVLIYMLAVVLVSLLRSTPVGRVLWAARNNYLYIVFFLCCAYTIKSVDFEHILKNVVRFQAFNVLCVMMEFFVFGLRGDNIGGMFGIQTGCNGYLNNYLFIITTCVIIMFDQKMIKLSYLIWILASSVALAAMAELKFFFIEIVVIILTYLVLSKSNANNAAVILGAGILVFIAIPIINKIDPDILKFFSNIDRVKTYASNNYDNTTISRTTAISQINSYFFHDDKVKNLFGYGFGYCESSQSFGWANSGFANTYSYLGYRNLSVSMIFLETGFVGLIGFVAIFVFILLYAQKYKAKIKNGSHLVFLSQIISVLAIINIWYNSCIRRETAYLTFFMLAGLLLVVRESVYGTKQSEDAPKKRRISIRRTKRRIKFTK